MNTDIMFSSKTDLWETLNKEYYELEPMLRQFVFGEETPELRLKNLKKGIEEFLKRNS